MTLDPAVAAVRTAVRRELEVGPRPSALVVACSGGADSLALLAATVFVARTARDALGVPVVGAVVDHGLQDGSAAVADRVVAQMTALGVDETVTARVGVEAAGQGVEAAAREARYAVLAQVAASFDATVLLGHTLDDQAETVLLGLARGSGGRSIAGMRRRYDAFRRPLLDVTRDETEAACRAEGIEWWTDPHNADPRFTRSRLRHRVLPVLAEELNPRVRHNLARTADLLRADLEALEELADAAYDRAVTTTATPDGRPAVLLGALDGTPQALRTRVLRRAALAAGAVPAELFAVHVAALDRLADAPGGAQVQLPGRVSAVRERDRIAFRPT